MRITCRPIRLAGALALTVAGAAPLCAAERDTAAAAPLDLSAQATVDLSSTLTGSDPGSNLTGIARLIADLDLDAATGWQGASLHAQALASFGTRPNDRAATVQGVNNIEVPENRAKLFEFYLEQALGGAGTSLRFGFSDLNAEFYATEDSALLLAPAFGIGSELSATGPNGPSLFPSTALTARLHLATGGDSFVNLAVVNAEAGVLGDRGGMAPLLAKGALVIGEAGLAGKTKVALGGWAYTSDQDDLRDTDAAGDPLPRSAFGFYLLFDQPLSDSLAVFARAGISDGRTTPYTGGWQAGLLWKGPLPARPNGAFSIGINQAYLSDRFRANQGDAGQPTGPHETGLELTYADELAPQLQLQPDLQWIRKADRSGQRNAFVATLRLNLSF